MDVKTALSVLGISSEAKPDEIRAAYLKQTAAHPPDKDPAEFEKIRDAYDLLKDPVTQFCQEVLHRPAEVSFKAVCPPSDWRRKYVSADVWMQYVKEKSK